MPKEFDRRVLIALVTTVLFWASAFPAIRVTVTVFYPGHLVLLRFLVASATLGVYALATRMRLPDLKDLPVIAVCGLTGVVLYHLLLNFGMIRVTAGSASMLVNASPVFTAILARVFLKERLRWIGWGGIALSFSGAALIAMGEGKRMALEPSALLILGSGLAASVWMIVQKPYFGKYTPLQFSTYVIWAGTLLMCAFSRGFVTAVREAPVSATLAVVYLGVFPTALGYVTWTYVLSKLPASITATFLFLIPGCVLVMAWIALREAPTLLSLGGGAVALTGVVVINRWGRAKAVTQPVSSRATAVSPNAD
ncbi:MAG: DMT family transporter [Candidatus Poribacteria bacterium]|nr:DMT family transporter [Candidatus Poribacteria bacterium]